MNSDSYKGGGRGGRIDLTGGRALGQNPYTDTGGETALIQLKSPSTLSSALMAHTCLYHQPTSIFPGAVEILGGFSHFSTGGK